MKYAFMLSTISSIMLALAWTCVIRSQKPIGRTAFVALGLTSLLVLWLDSLTLRMWLHPEYAQLPPWTDPINLDAGLMGLAGPVAIVAGFVAARKQAPWWIVAFVQLIAFPLTLVGCASAVSV